MNTSLEPAPWIGLFDSIAGLVVGNGWGTKHQLEAARGMLANSGRSASMTDRRPLIRFLVEQRVLTSEQATELDNLLLQQANFPAYRLLKKLGTGGMGTVYLAQHIDSKRDLAIKTIITRLKEDGDFVGRFHRESKVLAGLRHPNIAEVFESGDSNGVCYMALEYIPGPSLATLLRDHKVLPEFYVLRICRQVAEGLAYVYEKSELVHRDIKPENILILRQNPGDSPFPADDVAKLIDFGLVKPVDDDERLTQTGMTIGTPLYMSPEQIRGEKIDCRSDIYGLAATMYHLLTGVTPFTGTSPGAIMSAHLTQAVPDPGARVPGLSQRTRDLVMLAMAKQPQDRFLTFEGFIKAIDAAQQELGEKHGSAPRLLRKPLVLKGPVKRASDKPFPAEAVVPQSAAATRNATDRIVGKFRQAQADAAEKTPPPPSHANTALPVMGVAPPAAEREVAGGSGERAAASGSRPEHKASDALRAVHTERLQRKPGEAPPGLQLPPATARPGPAAGVPSASQQLKSAVFDEDPERPIGSGAVPWIVLGVALLILVAWLVLH